MRCVRSPSTVAADHGLARVKSTIAEKGAPMSLDVISTVSDENRPRLAWGITAMAGAMTRRDATQRPSSSRRLGQRNAEERDGLRLGKPMIVALVMSPGFSATHAFILKYPFHSVDSHIGQPSHVGRLFHHWAVVSAEPMLLCQLGMPRIWLRRT